MDSNTKKIILIFLCLLYLSSITPALGDPGNKQASSRDPGNNWASSRVQQQMIPATCQQKMSDSYTPHDPIHVEGNAEFTTEGFTGNGTIDDPYILENYSITSSTVNRLIEIRFTDAYFIIRNNYLDGINNYPAGIYLYSVTNGVIDKNTVVNTGYGIDFTKDEVNCSNIAVTTNIIKNNIRGIGGNAHNCNFTNNEIFDNTNSGITLGEFLSGTSISNIISNNTIHDNGGGGDVDTYGIYIRDGSSNLVMNNSVVNNDNGIFICGYSEHNTIYNNSFIGNRGYWGRGVYCSGSASNLTSNIIENNRQGIYIANIEIDQPSNVSKNIVGQNDYSIEVGSPGVSITENIFYSTDGIKQEGMLIAFNATVKWNDFIGNELDFDIQISKSGTGGSYFSENYWDDWTAPDADGDGIVDIPYPVDPGDLTDASPLTSPHNDIPVNLHLLSRPRLLHPKNTRLTDPPEARIELTGTVTVKWCPVTDFSGHSVSYALYYSPDWEESETDWEELATGLTTAEYEWDTTSIEREFACVMKVVATCSEGLASEYLLTEDKFTVDNRPKTFDSADGLSFAVLVPTLGVLVFASRRKKSG